MSDIKILLGCRIKELRKNGKISQQELAEKINIDQRNLSNIETGRSFPSKSLLDIANALNVTLSELFEFEHIEMTQQSMFNYITTTIQNFDKEKLSLVYKFIKSVK